MQKRDRTKPLSLIALLVWFIITAHRLLRGGLTPDYGELAWGVAMVIPGVFWASLAWDEWKKAKHNE